MPTLMKGDEGWAASLGRFLWVPGGLPVSAAQDEAAFEAPAAPACDPRRPAGAALQVQVGGALGAGALSAAAHESPSVTPRVCLRQAPDSGLALLPSVTPLGRSCGRAWSLDGRWKQGDLGGCSQPPQSPHRPLPVTGRWSGVTGGQDRRPDSGGGEEDSARDPRSATSVLHAV